MATTVRVKAECFGVLERQIGYAEVTIDLESPFTVAHLVRRLAAYAPSAADTLEHSACARGDVMLTRDAELTDGDAVAFLPPVSGGQPTEHAHLTDAPLDLNALMAETDTPNAGAVVVFGGTVRVHNAGRRVIAIDYSAHGPLAERALAAIEAETRESKGVQTARIQHRTGRLALTEASVYVVVRAAHREQAFTAARFAIDTLKARAPIWKQEHFADGDSAFVPGTPLEHPPSPGA